MAARPPKPPDSNSTRMVKLQSPAESSEDSYKCPQSEKSDCSCTNISIMQLFHEMKQVFPTVPDHVVNQCVIENCHDRENCIKNLNNELATHPNTAQVYPSQVLRGGVSIGGVNQQIGTNKKPLVPTRPAPAPKPNFCDPNRIPKLPTITTSNQLKQDIGSNIASGIAGNPSDMKPPTINSDNKKPNVPQRPTTLNFRDPSSLHHKIARTRNQPIRTAPPPPVPSGVKNTYPYPPPSSIQNTTDQNPNFNSLTSVQSPMSLSDSGESEISVNISLSPSSSDRSRGSLHPTTRRISSISVQPEPPYTRDFTTTSTPQSPRSFTSLNLTLRKPSVTPQPPIDITAGPGLTYTSSSYDAKLGYQQNFHITVTDGGGSFSTCRIRPRSCYNMIAQQLDSEFSPDPEQSNPLRTGISMPNVAQNVPPIETIDGVGDSQSEANGEIIQRQQRRKSKLANELRNNRKRLEEMDREINLLQSPIPPNESERLDWEIQKLRCDCERLCQEIERDGASGVSLQNVYDNIYNNSQQPLQRQRPPLPPALSRLDPQHLSQSSPITTPSTTTIIPNLQPSYPLASSVSATSQNYDEDDYANGNFADGNGPPWTCSMCTFQNYPLLNKCEECDNVRIIPGTVQIIPSSSATSLQFDSLFSAATPPSYTIPCNNIINNNHDLNAVQRNTNNSYIENNIMNNNALTNSQYSMNQLIPSYASMMNPISSPNANCVIPQ